MTDRDKKIIADSEAAGIPIFVLTAKDQLSSIAIEDYKDEAEINGCDDAFIYDVEKRIEEFKKWQAENIEKVKLPD